MPDLPLSWQRASWRKFEHTMCMRKFILSSKRTPNRRFSTLATTSVAGWAIAVTAIASGAAVGAATVANATGQAAVVRPPTVTSVGFSRPPGTVVLDAFKVTSYRGSFEACVISHESGGNPRAVNPVSGAGGLYGFLPSTWASIGFRGLPENASVATQHRAFERLYAMQGTAPWRGDGCA